MRSDVKLGIDRDADNKISDLVLSWHPLLRLILIILALITVTYTELFIYKLIDNLYYVENFHQVAYYIKSGFYYFLFINTRFGGFILLVLFLVAKKGRIANIILASLVAYPRIRIENIWIRVFTYFTAIISFGFILYSFMILVGITNSPFIFPTDIFDFLIKIFFAPISEEVYSRFLILYITASVFGRIPAVFISTLFFVIPHNLSQPYQILWVTSLGFTNAFLTIAYGTLWPAIGIHIVNNMIVYLNHPF